jgi:undecaprenyl-diphosphatase
MAGLRSVGVEVATLEPASVDARGSTPYLGARVDGGPLFVKVLGRDERSADLLFRLYRAAVPRHLGDERPFSSLRRAVEHEALVALTADRLGVRTPAVAALCDAEPGGFVLAYDAVDGRSLDRVDAGEVTDPVLRQVWEQLSLLRHHRIAHRDLRLANLFLDHAGEVWLIDFGFAELAASDTLLATDVAELVASLASKVGPSRVAATGASVLGADALTGALPRLRSSYLSGATRTALKAAPGLLDDIRGELEPSTRPPALGRTVGER